MRILRRTRDPSICLPAFGCDPHTNTLLLPSFFIRWREVPRKPSLNSPSRLFYDPTPKRQRRFLRTRGYFLAGLTKYHLPFGPDGRCMATPAAELAWMVPSTSSIMHSAVTVSEETGQPEPRHRRAVGGDREQEGSTTLSRGLTHAILSIPSDQTCST